MWGLPSNHLRRVNLVCPAKPIMPAVPSPVTCRNKFIKPGDQCRSSLCPVHSPTTAAPLPVFAERDAIIERQRDHLRGLDEWAKRLKGPCSECRWRTGGGGYERCTNPAVARGKPNPLNGDVRWTGPRCSNERRDRYHVDAWDRESGWEGDTLCGPEGLLFEPRTYGQFLMRWAAGALWLSPLLALLVVARCGG